MRSHGDLKTKKKERKINQKRDVHVACGISTSLKSLQRMCFEDFNFNPFALEIQVRSHKRRGVGAYKWKINFQIFALAFNGDLWRTNFKMIQLSVFVSFALFNFCRNPIPPRPLQL